MRYTIQLITCQPLCFYINNLTNAISLSTPNKLKFENLNQLLKESGDKRMLGKCAPAGGVVPSC